MTDAIRDARRSPAAHDDSTGLNPSAVAAMRRDPSTSSTLNEARRAAAYLDHDVEVRGDDVPHAALARKMNHHISEVEHIDLGLGALNALRDLAELGRAEAVLAGPEAALGMAGLAIGGAVASLAAGMKMLADKNEQGVERRAALARDELHVALAAELDLPAAFTAAELARYPHAGKSYAGGASKVGAQIELRPELKAVLQLHADRGMDAARAMHEAGLSPAALFAHRPEVGEQYRSDAAFKLGFDAMVWARNEGPQVYREAVSALEARDARYERHEIRWRA